VPWKDIVALHDHDAIGAFREKLIEAEDSVAGLPGTERPNALKDFGIEELLKRVRELMPSTGRMTAEVGAGHRPTQCSRSLSGDGLAGLKGVAELQRQQADCNSVAAKFRCLPPDIRGPKHDWLTGRSQECQSGLSHAPLVCVIRFNPVPPSFTT
jgi:hypothetical protein